MSVDKRESRVVVTQRQVTQVVSSGTQGPAGGQWANWDEIPDKPSTYPPSAHNHDTAYDPLGAAATAQAAAVAAAALDATGKIDALKDGVASDGDTLAKLRGLIQGIQTLLTSDNINLDTLQEVVDFVELHQTALEALGATKVNISDIINVLTDTSSNKPLSAAQGKVLKDALDALTAVVGGKEPTIASGTTAQYWRGDKSWRDFATDVRAAVLTGLSTATSTVVAAADSVLVAIGKLQAQITGHTGNTSNPHSTTAAQVGADPAGTAASSMSSHVAAADPHTQYALESSLGDAAWKNTGTTAGTVAAGDDARLTNSREWTASTVDQAEAEAGAGTTRRAWTAQRVRQAIAAWWAGITNIDGKNIGATTAGTGRFTTLEATGNTTLGDSSSDTVTVNGVMGVGATPITSAAILVESATLAGGSLYGTLVRPTADASKTSSFANFASIRTAASAFTLASGYGYYVGDANKGAGSTITNLYGIVVADQTQGVNNYGITSQVSAGTNKRNLNITGTADNVLMGNTGVGTASPDSRLHVSGGVFKVSGNSVDTIISYSDHGIVGTVTNHALALRTNNAERLRIDSLGNVGIGTSSPTSKLDVVGGATGAETVAAILRSNFTANGTGTVLRLTNSTTALTNVGSVELAAVRTNAAFTGDTDAIIRSCNSAGVMTDRMKFTSTGVVRPGADNTQSLGEASFRWSTVFAGTGTINTSDATLKTALRDFTDAELDAIGDCRLGIFQWLDAVAEKGDAARLHPGVIAQQIMTAFESRDLDPLRYAPICRDRMTLRVQTDSVSVWKMRPVMVKETARDERVEIIDGVPTVVVTEREVEAPKTEMRQLIGADGQPVMEEVQAKDEAGELLFEAQEGGEPIPVMVKQPVMYPCPVEEDYLDFEPVFEDHDAGWRYGIRYSQLLVMLAAHERRERERLAARVAALEAA